MYIYTIMQKATIQRQRLIADFIEEGNVSSQNQLKGMYLSLVLYWKKKIR